MVRGILGTYGPQLAAALVHDELCHRVELIAINGIDKKSGKPKTEKDIKTELKEARRDGRDYTDAVFLQAMRSEQAERVLAYQARLFWAGVSMMRYALYRKLHLLRLIFIEVIAGWLTILLALQCILTLNGGPLHTVFGNHWWTNTWVVVTVALSVLFASGYFIGRSKTNGIAWVSFWVSGLIGVYALCLWLPIPLTHRDRVPVVGWEINYGEIGHCLLLFVITTAIFLLCTFTRRRPDWPLGMIAVSAVPWALPVAILTFIAQRALQMPDNRVPAKPQYRRSELTRVGDFFQWRSQFKIQPDSPIQPVAAGTGDDKGHA